MNEDLEVLKASYNMVTEIKDIKENPVTETMISLVKSVPVIGGLVDTTATVAINKFQEKKQKELIQCILQNSNSITSDQVNDVEFIVNFAKTVEAVKRLATNDKIKYFGNLIRNGYLSGNKMDEYLFEEYFEIINSMSIREIQYLTAYKQYCDLKNDNRKDNRKSYHYFNRFVRDYANDMGVDRRSIYVVFSRLVRTGFVDEILETETGTVDDDKEVPSLSVEGSGYWLDKSFIDFYEMVLKER